MLCKTIILARQSLSASRFTVQDSPYHPCAHRIYKAPGAHTHGTLSRYTGYATLLSSAGESTSSRLGNDGDDNFSSRTRLNAARCLPRWEGGNHYDHFMYETAPSDHNTPSRTAFSSPSIPTGKDTATTAN